MDLYYAMTNYQLLSCILHKIVYNQKNNARILLSSFLIYHSPDLVEKLRRSEFFSDVLVYDEVIFSHEKSVEIQDEITRIRDNVGCKYGALINGSNNVYIGQDCDSLGVYLVSIGKEYYYFEDASGSYSKPEVLLAIIKKENPNRYAIIKKLGLIGKSRFVLSIYCDFENQSKSFDSSRCVDFSVKKILKTLDTKKMTRILNIYGCRRYDLRGKKKVLLLTWHYSNMGFMTVEEQRLFFTLLVDYFRDETEVLFIKPHPSDKQSNYKEWFDDAIVLERCMPSELLPFCVEGKFERGITNWSTSVLGLGEILDDVVNFDKDIDKTWRDFHKYFAISQYLNSIRRPYRQRIVLVDINIKQLKQLMKRYIKRFLWFYGFCKRGGIYIVDKYDEKYYNKRCIALNNEGGGKPRFALRIKHRDKTEFVYLYNLNKSDIYIEKELHYLGERVVIDICDME